MLARSGVETSRAFGLAYISLHHFFYLRLRGAKRLSITNVTRVKLGSGDDTVVIVFIVLLPLQPGVDSWTCWRHVWVEFIFGPRLCYEGFSPFTKNQNSTFQFDLKTVDKKSHLLEGQSSNSFCSHYYDFYHDYDYDNDYYWLLFTFIYIYILVHQPDANHAPRASVT